MNVLRHIWVLKSLWITMLAFILPCKLLIDYDPEFEKVSKCAYGIAVMAILWLTEAIPIPATALLPIFLFPMLGVAEAKDMSGAYITDTSMLFFGGLVVAVALVECGLHKRITLLVMRLVGAQPMWLMFGLMMTTWFLSMWISNTAAASMMIPIIAAVLETLQVVNDKTTVDPELGNGAENPGFSPDEEHSVDMDNVRTKSSDVIDKTNGVTINPADVATKPGETLEMEPARTARQESRGPVEDIHRLAKAFSLSVAYGANVGGIATLTGTPPNLVLKQFADSLYSRESNGLVEESDISFAKWIGFAFLLSFITTVIGWLWLLVLFLRGRCFKKVNRATQAKVHDTILKQYKDLGPLTFMEVEVMLVFFVLVVLWLFRAPPNMSGWDTLFTRGDTKYVSDSTPSILLSVLLFILPAKKPEVFCWASGRPSYTPILNWQKVAANLPWGVIILLGGGFAMAKASEESKLSEWVGEKLEVFSSLDTWLMNFIICCIVAGLTEMTSNTATATLLMPILSSLALSIGVHPLYLMISAAVACSFAFMLPVATPPNAIVFSTGYLTVLDMVIAGFPMNVFAVLCLTLSINTWGYSMYNLGSIPDFLSNSTVHAQPGLNSTT